MRRARIALLTCIIVCGCATAQPRKPKWEVSLSVNLEEHPKGSELTKVTEGFTIKRTIGGDDATKK